MEEKLDYDERAICMKQLLNSLAWKKYLLPWLHKQRERHKNILNIRIKNGESDIELLNKFKNNKIKCQVYNNLIRLPDNWIGESDHRDNETNKKN